MDINNSETHRNVTELLHKTQKKQKKTVSLKQIEEKRRKEREKKRRQREKIKKNPVALAEKREKDRQCYYRRKEKGTITNIHQKSKRDQRLIRKRWKINSKRYRDKQAIATKGANFAENNTPPTSPEILTPASSVIADLGRASSSRERCGRKKVCANRSATNRQLQKTKKKLQIANKKVERYKKRLQRLTQLSITTPSPKSKVKAIVGKKKNISKTVKKRLLFGEALVTQLKENRKELVDQKERQMFAKLLSGNILKKYRLMGKAKSFLSYKEQRNSLASKGKHYVRKKKSNSISTEIASSVRHFLEEDVNSRMCPGKKDHKTKNKMKVQKRLLLDTLKNLHKKYTESHEIKLSYSSFCRLRPFWIVEPRLSDRDTCACIKHANVDLIVNKLHQLKVLDIRTSNELCNSVCCNTKFKDCMYRKCKVCKNKEFNVLRTTEEQKEVVSFFQWKSRTEERMVKEKVKNVRLTEKQIIEASISDILQLLKKLLPNFLRHVFNIYYQYSEMKQLQDNLTYNALIIKIDYSENYVLKYHKEIQSVHFGASQKQISLHTGVMYYKVKPEEDLDIEVKDTVKCISFCTTSDNLNHSACATWAHLTPILHLIMKELPYIDTLHFQSDGPTAQYKNRNNFYFFVNLLPKLFPKIISATWNFSESGHGKGPMDGIGGTLKRTADALVRHGKDLESIDAFVHNLQEAVPGIKLIAIPSSAIEEVKSKLPNNIPSIPGIMKIHQIAWSVNSPSSLITRELSCFICDTSSVCPHHTVQKDIGLIYSTNETCILFLKNVNTKNICNFIFFRKLSIICITLYFKTFLT